MGVFVRLREQRRLSAWIVVAFLALGVISAGHHHNLSASDDVTSSACVACRAADPVRIVLPDMVVPEEVITSVVTPALTEPAQPQPCPRFSPRAPPIAA